jgi:hypothetical protein
MQEITQKVMDEDKANYKLSHGSFFSFFLRKLPIFLIKLTAIWFFWYGFSWVLKNATELQSKKYKFEIKNANDIS